MSAERRIDDYDQNGLTPQRVTEILLDLDSMPVRGIDFTAQPYKFLLELVTFTIGDRISNEHNIAYDDNEGYSKLMQSIHKFLLDQRKTPEELEATIKEEMEKEEQRKKYVPGNSWFNYEGWDNPRRVLP
jgi:hypothetical protein